eukprot:TRINITY_DN20339_c0_g1_i1.p1 TRINITY_DN20339_c0_g1~~TRINITY_DN20339_c0_g1_i1.p1  ORF type:complete len:260 (-),score=36.50 TRINITY_DN20339_c0_g1_i1:664-1443(-)
MIQATPDMCNYCFHVLHDHFHGQQSPPPPHIPNGECALFVTWKKYAKTKHEDLRGCKGTHGLQPLHEGLKRFALCSAFEDTRFDPIVKKEIPDLECSVSLLGCFERADNCYDWELGVHGMKIEFSVPNKRSSGQYCATFLPSVAVTQGWTKEKTIERLVQKSGYEGPITRELLAAIQLTRFQASVSEALYNDFTEYYKRYQQQQQEHSTNHAPPQQSPNNNNNNQKGNNGKLANLKSSFTGMFNNSTSASTSTSSKSRR